jgi:hypothetical protein
MSNEYVVVEIYPDGTTWKHFYPTVPSALSSMEGMRKANPSRNYEFSGGGEKKPASDWEPIFNLRVFDADGWDRRNFDESWAEPITAGEFNRRAWVSTCAPYDQFPRS